MKSLFLFFISVNFVFAQSTTENTQSFYQGNGFKITPIEHASFVLEAQQVFYFDPTGSVEDYKNFKTPDFIIITDIHRDHLDSALISHLKGPNTKIILPKAAFDILKEGKLLANGEIYSDSLFTLEAMPMYNLTEERLDKHPKGRGNGYLLTLNKQRIYVSGDTEDIIEMRQLKNIDLALVCMNLPFTMTPEQAASAVLEMKPKKVIPFHYRSKDAFSDIASFGSKFKDTQTEVIYLEWYKK